MLRRIKWAPVTSVLAASLAIILGIIGIEATITIPTALLGVTLGLVSRDN